MKKFVYNKEELKFDEKKRSIWKILLVVFEYVLVSFVIAIVYYLFFALIFNTDKEKKLVAENAYLSQEYEKMSEKADLVNDVVKSLEIRDREIYSDIFDADPPSVFSLPEQDSTSDVEYIYNQDEEDLIWDTHIKCIKVENDVKRVKERIKVINTRIADENFNNFSLPSIIPVKHFSIAQTGASVGNKINPFYKTLREHTGVDLLSPVGTEVMATANGVVETVSKSIKGMGNTVVIDHENGIKTVYSHLSDIYVRQGQRVGQKYVIARSGNSGTTFTPVLHYEVIRDGEYVDPVNYFFADLSPALFRDMMTISRNTGQSMD